MPRPISNRAESAFLTATNPMAAKVGACRNDRFETSRVTGLVVIVSSSAVRDLGLKKPFRHRAKMVLPMSGIASVADVVLLNITMEEYGQRLQSAVPEPPRTPEELS